MSNSSVLYVEDGGTNIPVAQLGLIAGKQQVVLGDFERDLILRTAGSVQIQVGNKFYPLNFNTTTVDTTNNTISVVNSTTTILATDDLLDTIDYPGDGNYVFITASKSFYIASGGQYLRINTPTTTSGGTVVDVLYLSYNTEQLLDGTQKLRLSLNTGAYIDSFSDIVNYTAADVYPGQLIYNIGAKKHYALTDPLNPDLVASWQPLYLSLIDGGLVQGPVVINLNGSTSSTKSALHVEGTTSLLGNDARTASTKNSILSIGVGDYSVGTAIWTDGNTYLQNLSSNSTQGFKFLATSATGLLSNPLTVTSTGVSIFGSPDPNYIFTINGISKYTDLLFANKGANSVDYSTGVSGFTLSIDPFDNKWLLEVDKVIIRDEQVQQDTFFSKSINGSYWSNPSVIVRTATYVDNYNVYTLASQSGNYSNTSGAIIPLTSKQSYALMDSPTNHLEGGSPRTVANTYVGFGFGDRDSGGTAGTLTTYIKDLTPSYVSVTPRYKYNGTSFSEDSTGTYVQSQSINIYYIETASLALLTAGDMLYWVDWSPNGLEDKVIVATVTSVTSDGAFLNVYNGGSITVGQELIIIGRSAANNSIHFNGIDTNGDYIESLVNVSDFRDVFENFYYSPENFEKLPINTYKPKTSKTTNKVGALNNLVDADLSLTGASIIGLYSSNAFLKGNFVVNKGIYNNIPLVTAYKPFLMLNTDNTMQQVDLSAKIASWDTVAGGTSNVYIQNQSSTTQTADFKINGNMSGNTIIANSGSISGQLNINNGAIALLGSNPTTSPSVYITNAGMKVGASGNLTHNYTGYNDGNISIDDGTTVFTQTIQHLSGVIALTSQLTGGTVTSVTSANGDISVATTTTTPVLTFNKGVTGLTSYYDHTASDGRYGQLAGVNTWSTTNNYTDVINGLGSGMTGDAMGPIGVTMPADANSYAMFGLTRSGATAIGIGMGTSNNLIIGTGAGRGNGATITSILFQMNSVSGDITSSGVILASGFEVPGGTGSNVLLDNGTTAAYSGGITYAEGTWTPAGTQVSGGVGSYIQIGNQIQAYFEFNTNINSSSSVFTVTGLPFANSPTNIGVVTFASSNTSISFTGFVASSATSFTLFDNNGTAILDSQVSGAAISGVVTYRIN